MCVNARSGGRCVNEDGSNGCVRRSAGVTDSRWTARDDAPAARAAASSSSHPIWLDELTCTGDEREVGECQRAGWGVHDCGHKEDAGCICTPRPTLSPVRGKLNEAQSEYKRVLANILRSLFVARTPSEEARSPGRRSNVENAPVDGQSPASQPRPLPIYGAQF